MSMHRADYAKLAARLLPAVIKWLRGREARKSAKRQKAFEKDMNRAVYGRKGWW